MCTSCTHRVQENGAIVLVVLQSAEILRVIIFLQYISYARVLNITPKPKWPRVECVTLALVCTSCTHGVQENGAIVLVVLQSAEILGLFLDSVNSLYITPPIPAYIVYDCREGHGAIIGNTQSISITFLFLFFFHQSILYQTSK